MAIVRAAVSDRRSPQPNPHGWRSRSSMQTAEKQRRAALRATLGSRRRPTPGFACNLVVGGAEQKGSLLVRSSGTGTKTHHFGAAFAPPRPCAAAITRPGPWRAGAGSKCRPTARAPFISGRSNTVRFHASFGAVARALLVAAGEQEDFRQFFAHRNTAGIPCPERAHLFGTFDSLLEGAHFWTASHRSARLMAQPAASAASRP